MEIITTPANNNEKLLKSLFTIMRDRYKDGYWYHQSEKPKTNREVEARQGLTDEQVNSLPEPIKNRNIA
jgi:hypothetical protein